MVNERDLIQLGLILIPFIVLLLMTIWFSSRCRKWKQESRELRRRLYEAQEKTIDYEKK